MADSSRNPADNFTWRELVRGLGAFTERLDALDQAQQEVAKDATATRRAVERAPKEQARIAAATARAAGPAPTEPKEVVKAADATEKRAVAEERVNRAYQSRSGLIVAEQRTSERAALEADRRVAEGRRRGVQEAQRLQRQLYERGGTTGALPPALRLGLAGSRGTLSARDVAQRAFEREQSQRAVRERQAQISEAERAAPTRARSVLSFIGAAEAERDLRPLEARLNEVMARAKLQAASIFDVGGPRAAQPPRQPPTVPPTAVAGGGDFEGKRDAFRELIGAQRQQGPAIVDLTGATERLAVARAAAAQAEARLSGSLAQTTRNVGLSSDAMRAHGALTTEFIAGAVKGQVTFRELGFQMVATIGKFAGWTAAATAVFGVARAFGQLGSGALDSLTGVTQMQRVVSGINTEAAQAEFRKLAHEFNLPIATVTEAAFEASRIFKDQDQIFAATRATLGGVAVAELTAAQAGQFLIAIQRGLGLSGKDLNDVLDAANQITNKFGGNTAGILEGTAKAAGAFRNAKGAGEDYADLLALIATGQAATGRTGAEIGTALRRSAEIVLRPDRRQKIIDLLGVDPRDTGFVALIRRGMAEVDKAMKAGDKSRAVAIARAISTPELASGRILPILQNRAFFEQRRQQAQPEERAGSVAREVAKRNESIRQQIAAIAVNLQVLGSALGSSGFLTSLGLGVRLLNTTLRLATSVVETFNKLPAPLREGLIVFAQYAAVMATLRRLDVGSSLAGRFPTVGQAFARRPASLERAEVMKGLGFQTKWFQGELHQTTVQQARVQYQQARAISRRDAYALTEGAPDFDQERMARHEARVARLSDQAADIAEDRADLAELHTKSLEQETGYARDTRRMDSRAVQAAGGRLQAQRAVADVHGIGWRTPGLDTPTGAQAVPIRAPATSAEQRRGVTERRAVLGPGESVAVPLVGTDSKAIDALERQQNSLRGAMAEQRQIAQRIFQDSGKFSAVAGSAAGAMVFAGRGIENTAKGLRGVGTAMLAAIGPLEFGIIAALATYETYRAVTQQVAAHKQTLARLDAAAGEGASPEKIRADAKKELGQKSLIDRYQGAVAKVWNVSPARFLGTLQSPDQADDVEARRQLKRAAAIEQANRKGVGLTRAEINVRLNKALRSAGTNQRDIDAAFAQAGKELAVGRLALFKEDPKAVAAGIASYKAFLAKRVNELALITGDIADAVPTDLAGLTTFSQALPTQIGLKGFRGRNIKDFTTLANKAITNALLAITDSVDPAELEQAFQVIQNTENAVLAPASERLQRLLAVARTPREQHQARSSYIAQVRATLIGHRQSAVDAISRRIEARNKQIADVSDQVDRDHAAQSARRTVQPGAQPTGPLDPGTIFRLPESASNVELKRADTLRELKAAQRADNAKLTRLADKLGISRDTLNGIIAEQAKADAQARLASYDATTSRLQSQTADPAEALQIAVDRSQKRVDQVRASFKAHNATIDELNAAIEKQNQDLQALAAQQASDFQSQQGVNASAFALGHFTDQSAMLNFALGQARNFQAKVKALGSKATPDLKRQALKGVNDANLAIAQYVREQAQAMISARADLRRAGTDDPVKQAKWDLDEANKLAKFAVSPVEKIQAQGKQLQARRALRTRGYESTATDIDFELQMDRIDKATAADRYEALAKRVHGNKALKRQYLLQAHQLRAELDSDAGGFDLDVGSIKLPTIVDVRRAFASIGHSQRSMLRDTARDVTPSSDLHSTINQLAQAQIDAQVNVYVNDPNAADQVYTALERALKTAVKAKAKNAGRR